MLANVASVFAVGELPAIPSESVLIETLKTKPAAEKAIACKQLAIVGTKECVPELAKLLSDKELSSWSRIALEAIPDPAADEALIEAAGKLSWPTSIGTINSIGVRKIGAAATDVLTKQLKDKNLQIASAAAVALGKIGNDDATKALRESLQHPPPTTSVPQLPKAVSCVPSVSTKKAKPTKQPRSTTKFAKPKCRNSESSKRRADTLLRKVRPESQPLSSSSTRQDKAFFQIGLMAARQLSGREVTDALSAELPKLASRHAQLVC